jgi:hypothetical protein
MAKNDVVVRTAQDLEKKYNFASLLGLKKNVEITAQGIQKIENELNSMLNALVINLKDVLDSQSEVSLWFYSGVPTTENEPYTNWTDPNEHIGDIYYDKNSGIVYQWDNVWEVNTQPDLVEAMAITNADTDTSTDHERKVFFETPTIPYSNGDWWIKADGSLFICQISKSEGTFEDNDFISTDNYTDSIAKKIEDTITVLKGTVTTMTENYAKFTDLATGGSTTIAGENISTGSIQSNNYVQNVSGMKIVLLTGIIDSKNFKTDTEGNVYLGDGAKVIGGDGLLTNLQYSTSTDYQKLGFDYIYPDYVKSGLYIECYIPQGFTIKEAKLTLYHQPIKMTDMGTSPSTAWCYARKIKLYKVNRLNVLRAGYVSSESYIDDQSASTEISNAFNGGYFTPSTPSDSNYATTSATTIDIKSSLSTGSNTLKLMSDYTITETSETVTEDFIAWKYSGYVYAVLNVIGYMSYE